MKHLTYVSIARRKSIAVKIFIRSTVNMASVSHSIRSTSMSRMQSKLVFLSEFACPSIRSQYTMRSRIKNKEFFELYETDKKWSLFFTPKREAKIFVQAHSENFGWDFRPHVVWEPVCDQHI